MGLVEAIKIMMQADEKLKRKIRAAERIELNYTFRLKTCYTQWITQLIIDREITAIQREDVNLHRQAVHETLKKHASQIQEFFQQAGIRSHPAITGYYMKNEKSEYQYGKLT